MSPRLLIDMNLSVDWVAKFVEHGWHAVHWAMIGDPTATDSEIMASARSID